MKKTLIYDEAITKFGIGSQKMMLIEEIGELLNVFAKFPSGRSDAADIIDELADVSIMVEQMAVFYGWRLYNDKRKEKIERLVSRLKKKQVKRTDYVESKFHVGDWLQYRNANPFLVEMITKQGYVNGNSCLPFNWENEIHLWTIEDAKDGDVLATSDGNFFIFKGLLDKFHSDKPVAYCGIDTLGNFMISSGVNRWTDENIYPSTKEQRDILFQKMYEAGYGWDTEKKELYKIK